jgi:hypothetical protein
VTSVSDSLLQLSNSLAVPLAKPDFWLHTRLILNHFLEARIDFADAFLFRLKPLRRAILAVEQIFTVAFL